MRRTTAKRILLSVIVYDILIALLAYGVFGKSGTVYGKNRAAEEEAKEEEKKQEEEEKEKEAALEEDQADGSETSKIVVEDDTDDMTETGVDSMLAASEPTTIYKDWTDLYDAMGKLDTQESSDEGMSIMDFLPEEPEEPEPAPEPLYTFVTNNVETHLNMRDGPDLTDTIIHKLKPGSKGVVLELGDGWSHVTSDGYTGYCSNDYLTMKEVTQEEYDSLKSEAEAGLKEAASGNAAQSAPAAAQDGNALLPPLSTPDGGQALQVPMAAPDAMLLPAGAADGTQAPAGTDGASHTSDGTDDDADTTLDTEEITDGTGQAASAP